MAIRDTHNAVAGAVEGFGKFGNKVAGGVGSVVFAPIKGASKFVWNNTKKMFNGAAHVAAVGTGAFAGFIRSPLGKKMAIGTLIVGGIATAGIMMGKSRSSAKQAAEQPSVDSLPDVTPPQLEAAAATGVDEKPPGYWTSRATGRDVAPQANTRA
jgi:hypothetical protein